MFLLDFGESHFESRVPGVEIWLELMGSLQPGTSLVGEKHVLIELLAMILTTGDKLNEAYNYFVMLCIIVRIVSINANEAASSLEESSSIC